MIEMRRNGLREAPDVLCPTQSWATLRFDFLGRYKLSSNLHCSTLPPSIAGSTEGASAKGS